MIIQQFEVPGLSHYSYLVGSEGQAVVIDPKRDIETYLEFAKSKELKITHILETHIHADYASGATALREAAKAALYLSSYDDGEDFSYNFSHFELQDRQELKIGGLRIVALHTPGHTPEHMSYVLYDNSKPDEPVALFSGDFIFIGSVGRPDLLGDEAKKRLAHLLYESVQSSISHLPDSLKVLPGHGAGSMCGAGMANRPQSTLGEERTSNSYLIPQGEREFINKILGSLPPLPDYYQRMKRINSEGPRIFKEIPGDQSLAAIDFSSLIKTINAVVLDLRKPEEFGKAHVPGSFSVGAGVSLSTWAAWVVPYDRSILLVGDETTDIDAARRCLVRVGLDDVRGYLKGGMQSWEDAKLECEMVKQETAGELFSKMAEKPFILDVRNLTEWNSGRVEGAKHIPANEVEKRMSEIPKDQEVHVMCAGGYRSSIAASVLKRGGVKSVSNVIGGISAWKADGLQVVK